MPLPLATFRAAPAPAANLPRPYQPVSRRPRPSQSLRSTPAEARAFFTRLHSTYHAQRALGTRLSNFNDSSTCTTPVQLSGTNSHIDTRFNTHFQSKNYTHVGSLPGVCFPVAGSGDTETVSLCSPTIRAHRRRRISTTRFFYQRRYDIEGFSFTLVLSTAARLGSRSRLRAREINFPQTFARNSLVTQIACIATRMNTRATPSFRRLVSSMSRSPGHRHAEQASRTLASEIDASANAGCLLLRADGVCRWDRN